MMAIAVGGKVDRPVRVLGGPPLSAALVGLCVGVVSGVLLAGAGGRGSEPRDVFDVARAARDRGLCTRSDVEDGRIERTLVVSRVRLKWEQVRDGRPAVNRYPGVVFVREAWMVSRDDEADRYWGGVALFGDPALIDELVGGKEGGAR